jgi:hypothetical protein
MLNKRKLIMKDVLKLLQLNNSYDDRIKEIEEYMSKNNTYKTLNINVASNSLNSKTIFNITPYGMTDGDRGNIRDGIVLFGYEKKHNKEEIIEENDKKRLSVYDFAFPIEKEKESLSNLTQFPSFSIYFNTKDSNYYIKDFNSGIGALMKIKEYKIEYNILINIGRNYLVICLEKDCVVIKIFNHDILEKNNHKKKQQFEVKKFPIEKNKDCTITIGRSKKCNLTIDDMMMSKIQSSIKYNSKENSFYLCDGNSQKESMNGTWVYILNPVLLTDYFIFKAEHTLFVVNVMRN